jgi:cysteine desulfurase family protein
LRRKQKMAEQYIFMNYASTSPYKSEGMTRTLIGFLEQNRHVNTGRNFDGLEDADIMRGARKSLAELFGAPKRSHVIFTSGITGSLNMIFGGLLRPGDHVLTTQVEHNAVARPLTRLQQKGIIDLTILPCASDGGFDPAEIPKAVRPETRLLVMTHSSNVLGTILPAGECFQEAKRFGLFTLLDTAQTAGLIPVALDPCTDALAFTGHKGLGALQGTGGFVLNTGAAEQIEPWITGGTGSLSHLLTQPGVLPDKFESGTPNTLGILSLGIAGKERLGEDGPGILLREQSLTRRFLEGIDGIPGLTVYGPKDPVRSTPVVSVAFSHHDSAMITQKLYSDYGILTRCGLHCAPLAHQCAGTFPEGTIRFSFGRETTEAQIDAAVTALECLSLE